MARLPRSTTIGLNCFCEFIIHFSTWKLKLVWTGAPAELDELDEIALDKFNWFRGFGTWLRCAVWWRRRTNEREMKKVNTDNWVSVQKEYRSTGLCVCVCVSQSMTITNAYKRADEWTWNWWAASFRLARLVNGGESAGRRTSWQESGQLAVCIQPLTDDQ